MVPFAQNGSVSENQLEASALFTGRSALDIPAGYAVWLAPSETAEATTHSGVGKIDKHFGVTRE